MDHVSPRRQRTAIASPQALLRSRGRSTPPLGRYGNKVKPKVIPMLIVRAFGGDGVVAYRVLKIAQPAFCGASGASLFENSRVDPPPLALIGLTLSRWVLHFTSATGDLKARWRHA